MNLSQRQLADAADIAEGWIRYQALMNEVPAVSYGLSHEGRTVRQGAFGVADLATERSATSDDCYRVASITKTVTATLVMQLVERGKLRLDDDVATHIPWLDSSVRESNVTVRHLLTHSGGIIRDGSCSWGDEDLMGREDLRAELRNRPTFAEPSTTFRYSNIAYAMLGEILQAVTSRGFSNLVDRRIARPLELVATDTTLTPRIRSKLATGYYRRRPGEAYRAATPNEARAFGPAGGLISNVADLLRYQEAHFPSNLTLLGNLSKREMQRTQWQRAEEPNHGLGWMLWNVDGIKLCGHSGGYPGFNTKIAFAPDLKVATAALTNTIGPTAGLAIDVIFHAIARVNAMWDDAAASDHGHTRASLARFRGHYRGEWGEVIVARIHNSLFLVDPDAASPLKDAARLAPRGARRFLIVDNDDYGHQGETVSFTVDRGGHSTTLRYGPHTMTRADI